MAKNSQTEENYLKALYNLANENDEVNASDLSQNLGVSMPTVNSMVKRLADRDYLLYQKYRPLKLTREGKMAAAGIIRKHRLTEMFLVEKMGFGWEEVHDIAEQIEHIQSERYFDRMDELLGFPRFDPHGSPIPDENGEVISQDLIALSDCRVGDKLELKALNQSSEELLKYLNDKELAIGTRLEVIAREEFDESMEIRYAGDKQTVLSIKVCKRLMLIR